MVNFDHGQIKWCAMHTLNLGVAVFMLGSALRVLAQAGRWPGESEDTRLRAAFADFSAWAKDKGIPSLG